MIGCNIIDFFMNDYFLRRCNDFFSDYRRLFLRIGPDVRIRENYQGRDCQKKTADSKKIPFHSLPPSIYRSFYLP